jgi:uncharacterized protein involved in cysteine biosynthesis
MVVFILARMAAFYGKSRANRRHFVGANKVALEVVRVPAREHKSLAVVTQNLVGQLLNIVPTVGNVNRKILAANVLAMVVNDGDLVFGNAGVHHAYTMAQKIKKVKLQDTFRHARPERPKAA